MSKDILYTVKKAFDENGIEIAYPRRQIVIDPQPRKGAVAMKRNTESRKLNEFDVNDGLQPSNN